MQLISPSFFSLRTPWQRGFSILELAIVLLILSALTASLVGPISNYVHQRQIAETQKILEETREALLGFAAANGRLPRPAISAANGAEGSADTATEDCLQGNAGSMTPAPAECAGFIPWQTLGTSRTDAWGNLIQYSVMPCSAIQNNPITFNLNTIGSKSVQSRSPNAAATSLLANNLFAIVWSTGRRNLGWAPDAAANRGNQAPVGGGGVPSNIDEMANDNLFQGATNVGVSRDYAEAGVTGGEFDDQLVWLSNALVFNRLLTAGRNLGGTPTQPACQ